jgi:hypothetical protein
VPELAVGLVIVSVCALGALLWSRSLTATTTVIVAASEVSRGQILGVEDFVAAEVRGGNDIGLLSADQVDQLVGRVTLVAVPAGAPVIEAMVGDLARLGADEALTGVALERGHAPSDLAVGDAVRVIVVPNPSALDQALPLMLDTVALVRAIEPADDFEPRAVVTLGLPLEFAADVAAAHGVRLVGTGS